MTFEKYHPIVLMAYFAAILLICMFSVNPVIQLLALLGGGSFCILSPQKKSFKGFLAYLILFLLITCTNPLFSHRGATPLFFINGNPVTLEALAYGAGMGVMLTGVLVWCRGYSLVMTSDKFLYLFGKAIPKLSLVLSMALRFIPLFRRQLQKVSRAQKTMGLYSSESYPDRVKSALRVFLAVVGWSVENAMDTGMSMRARGYGLKGRTSFFLFRFTMRDGVLLCVMGLLAAVTFVGTGAGLLAFDYYPYISPIDCNGASLAIYLAFGIFSFLPVLLELEERIKWNYCVSKI